MYVFHHFITRIEGNFPFVLQINKRRTTFSIEEHLTFIPHTKLQIIDERTMEHELFNIYIVLLIAAWNENHSKTTNFLNNWITTIEETFSDLFIAIRLLDIRNSLTKQLTMNLVEQDSSEKYWESTAPWTTYPEQNLEDEKRLIRLLKDESEPYIVAINLKNHSQSNLVKTNQYNIEENCFYICPLDWDAKLTLRKYSSELLDVKDNTFISLIPFADMHHIEISPQKTLLESLAHSWLNFLLIYPICVSSLTVTSQILLLQILLFKFKSKENIFHIIQAKKESLLRNTNIQVKRQQIHAKYDFLFHQLDELFIHNSSLLKESQQYTDEFIEQLIVLRPGGFLRTVFLFTTPREQLSDSDKKKINRLITSLYYLISSLNNQKIFFKGFTTRRFYPGLITYSRINIRHIYWEEKSLNEILNDRLPDTFLRELAGGNLITTKYFDRIIQQKSKFKYSANGSYGRLLKQLRKAYIDSGFLNLIENQQQLQDEGISEEIATQISDYFSNHYPTDQFNNE